MDPVEYFFWKKYFLVLSFNELMKSILGFIFIMCFLWRESSNQNTRSHSNPAKASIYSIGPGDVGDSLVSQHKNISETVMGLASYGIIVGYDNDASKNLTVTI
jgi:hypothetical protein